MEKMKHTYLHKILFPKGASIMQYCQYAENIKRSKTYGNSEDIYTEVYCDTPDYAEGKAKALVNITFKISQAKNCDAKDITISKHSLVVISIIRKEEGKPNKPRKPKKPQYEQMSLFTEEDFK